MTTLMAQRVNRNGRRGQWGTWGGNWVLQNGDTVVATGYQHLRERFDIEFGGRRLQIRYRHNHGCVIVDEASGRQVLELAYQVLQPAEESALVTLSSGVRLHWTLQLRHRDRRSGFYDDAGAPVVMIGNEVQFDTSTRRSTWGYLWRFWLAVGNMADHYRAEIDDATAARLLWPDEVITLVMLSIWLDTSKDRRQVTRLANSS